ncbi:acyl-CoA thioester hydrolase, YbgC/YbaW family [Promicromonospora umidemergens]|uniref:Thioesterase family protein n=2 Tax=Promicromonospora umidemergens TaxID=629679 RepID=A0ABP8XB44_9MICO|nr:acyl-CoA thioesterase [Promicromonospora umidemergens]MCP2281601.1 acyl-CoA thioester hydrolase, YbgC/YbaW family [Promicromonospora umidemergens]
MLQLTWTGLFPRKARPGQTLLDPSVTRMRVGPLDLDSYLHVNNGTYLQMMDVARNNQIADLGMFPIAREKGWAPVVAASTMKYRRSLQPFDRFEITTRIVGWDERMFYLEQVFTRGDKLYARGIVASRFLDRKGNRISAFEVVRDMVGEELPSPELPEDVAAWARAMDVAPREPATRS